MPENIIIETLNWAWNQKEWMFDGIGNDLIGWVFVSLCAIFLYFKNKFFKSKKHDATPTIPQPAFDLDNSTAKITRTPIIGNVPHGLVRATNGGRIEFTDSLIISNQNFVEFPLPTEIYSKNNSAELKITVKNQAIKLRKFDTDISSTQDSLFRKGNYPSSEYSDLSVQNNNHFNQYVREDSLKLMSEILNRLEPISRASLPLEMRCGIDAALHGKLTGSHPARGLADFLEFIVEKLD